MYMIGRLNMNEKLHDITLNGIMLDIIVYRQRKNNLQHTSNFNQIGFIEERTYTVTEYKIMNYKAKC